MTERTDQKNIDHDSAGLLSLSATTLSSLITGRQVAAAEALDAVFSKIEEREEKLHCYITIDKEGAYRRAKQVQEDIDSGLLKGPLAGVPVAVKDNICTKGLRTTCGSKMLEHFVPTYDAAVMEKLGAAGCILIGKTNMDEFAFGSTTETSAFGPTYHPLDPTLVPGGSSGGSAAAVASGEAFAALGSDTGGSVRQPATCCGVVGCKPTYGSVSRYGLVAYASSMDQIGPLAKNAADCRALFSVICGQDHRDATSVAAVEEKRNFDTFDTADLKGLRIGALMPGTEEENGNGTWKAVSETADRFRKMGAGVSACKTEFDDLLLPVYYVLAQAEASSNLERFDGVKYGYRTKDPMGERDYHEMVKRSRSEGFGSEVRRRILTGCYVLSEGYYDAYYAKAMKIREKIREAYDRLLTEYDLLLGPVMKDPIPKIGESLKDPFRMYSGDLYTVAANLTGHPAISFPAVKDAEGLPIGLQLTGRYFEEGLLFAAVEALEGCRENSN